MYSTVQEDGTFKLDGVDLHIVKVMGVIEGVDEHSTSVTYRVNDGTGAIECKLWNEKDSPGTLAAKLASCRYHFYLVLTGMMNLILTIVANNHLGKTLSSAFSVALANTRAASTSSYMICAPLKTGMS
jgi:hypothetical protein